MIHIETLKCSDYKHVFIINPQAGSKDVSKSLVSAIKTIFTGLDYEIRFSTFPGETIDIAEEVAKRNALTRIYACGGDGTLNEVVQGVVGFDNVEITHIPYGSGNDFLKNFKDAGLFELKNFTRDTVECRRVDLIRLISHGEAEQHVKYSINGCSSGLDARIGTDISTWRHGIFNKYAYKISTAKHVLRPLTRKTAIRLSDGSFYDDDITLACICNGGWYGGSFHACPEAAIDDGMLDVIIIKKVSLVQLAKMIGIYARGDHKSLPPELVHYHRVKSLSISTTNVEPLNIDGEVMHSAATDIEVMPSAIKFFAPQTAW